MKWIVPVLFALASGPAIAAKAKTAVDEFDGAQRVWIDPHGLDCGMRMVCASFGARWTSSYPDEAVLVVEVVNEYVAIESVALNIDGAVHVLEPLEASRPTSFRNLGVRARAPVARFSTKDFSIPLDLAQAMLAAQSVKVRVTTAGGLVDATFAGGRKATKARGALERFLALVPTAS